MTRNGTWATWSYAQTQYTKRHSQDPIAHGISKIRLSLLYMNLATLSMVSHVSVCAIKETVSG